MRAWRTGTLVAIGTAVAACATVNAVNGSKSLDGELTVDADVGNGLPRFGGAVSNAEVHVAPVGDAAVTFTYLIWRAVNGRETIEPIMATQNVSFDAADRETLRACIERSEFFGRWADGELVTDEDTWHVTVRCGDRTKSRRIYAQKEFDETERFLRRAIDQAVAEYALAHDGVDVLAELFGCDECAKRVLHVEPITTRLRGLALHETSPETSALALATLGRLLPADEFDPMLRAALGRDDAAFRQATLATFVDRGAIALPLRHRDVVLPAALAEIERSGREWGRPPAERAQLLRDCASALVVEHEVRAAPVFERMVVDLSTDERPLVLAPLPGLGDAAIDPLSRLLDHERIGVRIAAAQMCEGLACELTSRSACARPQGCAPSRTLAPFRERLVPKLERAADDASADPRLRRAASEALAAIGDRAAPPGWKRHRLDWN